MGIDSPRLCVQVKSSDNPLEIAVFRELQGTMKNFGAQQGLLVSWGGFKNTILQEARRFSKYFYGMPNDIVNAIIDNYHKLSDSIQAELPLKQTWVLVMEE